MQEETLNNYTTDLFTLIKHTHKAVKTQQTSSKLTNNKASNLLHDIDLALSGQLKKLEGMDDLLNDSTKSSIKETFAAFTGAIAGALDTQRKDAVSKMLRDDYTALSMIATGYTMLHTAALGADHQELADFTKESLTQIAALITQTSEVIPHAVADELEIGGVAEQAEKNTQECWKPENFLEEA
ncbi:hypothetical protein [Gracilimonas mengyeensis]|uniref:Ferritin-like metal-binding protein YciE n=1 Tax=Gracilimonas mengyeensis TaxID=1302730 RepID=A0A521C195_9BACT|nr:hypothetical protein [Gracilimonas mengyeensis]SMO53232.1 hypothetical protein SAMN06265219_10480 [Gracilimonas mengyeensis]